MKRLLFLLLLCLPGTAWAQYSTTVQRIGTTDSQPISAANPLPTTAAVAGTVTVQDGGGSITVDGAVTVNAGAAPLQVGDNAGSLTVDTPQLPATLGQKAMAASAAVTIASDQSALPVTDGGGSLTVDGAVTATIQANAAVNIAQINGVTPAIDASGNLRARTHPIGAPLYYALDPDQIEAANDIPMDAGRDYCFCQNVGTTAAICREGGPTGGTLGEVIGAGVAPLDGTGGGAYFWSQSAIYCWDLGGAGTSDLNCTCRRW